MGVYLYLIIVVVVVRMSLSARNEEFFLFLTDINEPEKGRSEH